MNNYFLRTFELPSRFTFLERHVMAIKALAMCLPPRDAYQMLDAGPGVFEPFVLGAIVERCTGRRVRRIDAVDQDARVCDLLERLLRREPVPVEAIAAVSTNFEADGTPRPNRDLASAARLAEGAAALEQQGIPAGRWFQHEYRMFLPGAPFMVRVWQQDIASFILGAPAGAYDLALFGAVLVNIAKVKAPEQIMAILRGLRDALSPGAVLGITTTPKEFLEPASTLDWIQSSGFHLVCSFAERLVIVPDEEAPYPQIHGDVVAVFQRSEDSLGLGPAMLREKLSASLSAHPNIRAMKTAAQKRAIGDRWQERWFPVGWIPDDEAGHEFVLDLGSLPPGEQYLLSDVE